MLVDTYIMIKINITDIMAKINIDIINTDIMTKINITDTMTKMNIDRHRHHD